MWKTVPCEGDIGVVLYVGYMGGWQNYGAFLVPHYNTAPNI